MNNQIRKMLDEKFKPENIKEVTGEYLYYKGLINGLEKAKGLTEKEIETLISVYSVKTAQIDLFLNEK